jgi:hypothetical protein
MPPRKRKSPLGKRSSSRTGPSAGKVPVKRGKRLEKPREKPLSGTTPKRVQITKTKTSVHIDFANPSDVLPHLLNLASDFAGKHFATATYTSAEDDVLGTAGARTIVSGCANSTCWNCTLGDLKLDSALFQGCVYDGVQNAGYAIQRDQIPASQDTQLFTVVISIQGAKKKG